MTLTPIPDGRGAKKSSEERLFYTLGSIFAYDVVRGNIFLIRTIVFLIERQRLSEESRPWE
jgi:hypothetical protein